MAYLNKVFIMGNLTRDPELRYTPNGTPVSNFGIAINKIYSGPNGERKEDTCFIDIEAFGRNAELCSERLAKGRQLFVEGRLRYRTWETPEGQKRNKLSVVAEHIQFIDRRTLPAGKEREPSAGEEPAHEEPLKEPQAPSDDIPF
jgi:single-strand DNA-binding protein